MAETSGPRDAAVAASSCRGLVELHRALGACVACDLGGSGRSPVAGRGTRDPDVLLVDGVPGVVGPEDRRARSAPADGVLERALQAAGVDPTRVHRTHAVKHPRPAEHRGRTVARRPTLEHLARCRPWLFAEVALLRPRAVVLLGSEPWRAVFDTGVSLDVLRGRALPWPDGPGPPVVLTAPPATVLRARDRKAAYERLVADLRAAAPATDAGAVHGRRPPG